MQIASEVITEETLPSQVYFSLRHIASSDEMYVSHHQLQPSLLQCFQLQDFGPIFADFWKPVHRHAEREKHKWAEIDIVLSMSYRMIKEPAPPTWTSTKKLFNIYQFAATTSNWYTPARVNCNSNCRWFYQIRNDQSNFKGQVN